MSVDSSAVLVTGATGFVGSWVCSYLEQAGIPFVRAVRANPVSAHDVVIGDIGPHTRWDAALRGVGRIVHMAAHVHRMRGQAEDRERFARVNVAGTEALARQGVDAGVGAMVFLSSVKVHGERTLPGESWNEEHPLVPDDFYARSKQAAEEKLKILAQQTGLSVTTIRPPLVYGPGVGANFLSLLRIADSALPLPLASIRNRRSLLYVENLAAAITRAVERPRPGYRAYLISDGADVSTPELIGELRSALGRRRRLFRFPPPLLELLAKCLRQRAQWDRVSQNLCVRPERIQQELNWHPHVSVQDGLRRTCEWYRSRKAARE